MAGIISLLILLSIALIIFFATKLPQIKRRNKLLRNSFPEEWKEILDDKVSFYRILSSSDKEKFCNKIKIFLSDVRITGVEIEITDTLRLLVACSATIPVFAFDDWHYVNLGEVLIYDGLVDTRQASDFEIKQGILGQVRPFQSRHLLLLSKQSLEKGFDDMNNKSNVGLHEFAHLLDEADGAIDGVPRVLMPPELIQPWTELIYKEINRMKRGKSDINAYGVSSHAEFFAVVCEYFFENQDQFKKKHEDLYFFLRNIFSRKL